MDGISSSLEIFCGCKMGIRYWKNRCWIDTMSLSGLRIRQVTTATKILPKNASITIENSTTNNGLTDYSLPLRTTIVVVCNSTSLSMYLLLIKK
jgi:hypothetical protein